MARILITGGAGFIGSHLADKCISEGHEVFIIDDLSGGFTRNLPEKATFFKVDLRNQKQAEKIIEPLKIDIVYHLAANAAENKAQFSPIDISTRNYNTFINTLVPAIRGGMKRFVVTSSIAVYGALQTPFKETDEPMPEDLYGISKLMIEKSLAVLAKVHHFEYVITRPHNVYGPRQNPSDPYRNVVTIFMNALLKGEPYYIYGDGLQERCFSYIDDVVDALYICGFADVHGMTFNIGSDKNYTLNELSETIQKVADVHIEPKRIPMRPQEVKIAISDHTQAKKHLAYKDSTSLTSGLQATWEYMKSLGYVKPKFTKLELDSPLVPENWRKN